MNDQQEASLNACSDEINGSVMSAIGKHDIRLVLAAIGASLATVGSSAIAAGIEWRYVLEVVVGALDYALTPPEKAPVVMYLDDGEHIGRKH